jgi:peptidoglycan hydrolase CwlO-like protein
MKRMTFKIALVTAISLMSALPALAGVGMGNSMMGQDQQNRKDECLLMAKNCNTQIDSIQQRIGRINHEISKGSAVYTRDELRKLNDQLEDANRTLELIQAGGA